VILYSLVEMADTLELLTIEAAASLLQVSTATVRRLIADGRLVAVRVGRGLRVKREAVARLAAAPGPGPRKGRAAAVPKGRPTAADDPLWRIVGIGASAAPTDVARHKRDYLAEAAAPRA
jgi:excisionase family DNA binding protein